MLPGYHTRLGIDATNPIGRGYEFESCSLSRTDTLVDASGLCGTTALLAAHVIPGTYSVAGLIELSPGLSDLQELLTWVMGRREGDQFTLAESLAARTVQVDRVVDTVTYADCFVDRAVMTGGVGQRIRLQLQLLGKSETIGEAGRFPDVATSHDPPCVFTDTRLLIADNPFEVTSWTLTIDHHAQAWFGQSVTATHIRSLGRTIQLAWSGPRSAAVDIDTALRVGAPLQLQCTQNGIALDFDFARLQTAGQQQIIRGREPLVATYCGLARRTVDNLELVVRASHE